MSEQSQVNENVQEAVIPPAQASEQKASVDDTIKRLATLSEKDYELERKKAAKEHGIKLSSLDKWVASERPAIQSSPSGLVLESPEPWDHAVELDKLLSQIARLIHRCTVLPEGAVAAASLWVVFTYVYESFMFSPRLLLNSPAMRCGKSTLLGLIKAMSLRALPLSQITGPGIFRTIESLKPTLMMDEGDTFLPGKEDMRGIINSGHSRHSSNILRINEDMAPQLFNTWAPMLIAMIGKVPHTIKDRSILIPMKRKLPSETVEVFDPDNPEFEEVRSKAMRWAIDNAHALKKIKPVMPSHLNDRAKDNWRPLFAIAQLAGTDWMSRAEHAALKLTAHEHAQDENASTLLLADLRDYFADTGITRLTSRDIVNHLNSLDHRPWPEWKSGKLTARQLAELLAPFGIHPQNVRIGGEQHKGYLLADMDEEFTRYLA